MALRFPQVVKLRQPRLTPSRRNLNPVIFATLYVASPATRIGLLMNENNLETPSSNPNKVTLDEKIVRKKSIPAQIVFWLVAVALLYMFYKAFSGHPGH
jgi:hypothetical protein